MWRDGSPTLFTPPLVIYINYAENMGCNTRTTKTHPLTFAGFPNKFLLVYTSPSAFLAM